MHLPAVSGRRILETKQLNSVVAELKSTQIECLAAAGAAGAEKAVMEQSRAYLSGATASPSILQCTSAELLKATAERLFVKATQEVEKIRNAARQTREAVKQLAVLKAAKPSC